MYVLISTDLLTTENYGMCSKFIISLIRSGVEKFGKYSFTAKSARKFSNNVFKEKYLKDRYNDLVNDGVIVQEDADFTDDKGKPYKWHIDTINEERLKEILAHRRW